jgi:bifunctional UDP-N-acetylglucosamine pyrophosphorylase/glucosamine-1-phosphate N-acetyltransferase
MRSDLPKVLHRLLGKPMLQWVVDACAEATGHPVTVVVGPDSDAVRQTLQGEVKYVVQAERLGTGHAVLQVRAELEGNVDGVLVVNGDLALVLPGTLKRLMATQAVHSGPLALLSARSDSARGFGRLIRDMEGSILQILEAAHATPDQLTIDELNVGAYCYRSDWLWPNLEKLKASPKGEYYLTDLVEIAARSGETVVDCVVEEASEAIGINNRVHLAEAESALRQRINRRWMLAGVTLQDPSAIYIGPEVDLAPDVTLLAGTHLEGRTSVGSGSVIGPNSIVRDSSIGEGCEIRAAVVEGATLEAEVDVGPFSHLRKNAHLGRGVHVGNYGEVKNSRLGPGVKMGHFSYLGDATVGADVNIGAGTITCNFDGVRKQATEIGDGAFIGSDTMLVAPIRIGKNARTGAGAVVTKDVPDGTVAVGVPARVVRRLENPNE